MNLCAIGFEQDYTSNYCIACDYSHGTIQNAMHHKRMMEQIANEISSKKVNKAIQEIYP